MIVGRTLLVATLPLMSMLSLGWCQREFCRIVKLRADLYCEGWLSLHFIMDGWSVSADYTLRANCLWAYCGWLTFPPCCVHHSPYRPGAVNNKRWPVRLFRAACIHTCPISSKKVTVIIIWWHFWLLLSRTKGLVLENYGG